MVPLTQGNKGHQDMSKSYHHDILKNDIFILQTFDAVPIKLLNR